MILNSQLRAVFVSAGLKHQELENVLDSFEYISVKKGTHLLQEGEISNHYYWVEKGLLRSYAVDLQGHDITTGFMGHNQIALEAASFFLRTPTKEYIEALADCVCWKTNFHTFQKLFHEVAPYREWGRTHLVKKLVKLQQGSLSRITDSAKSRYLQFSKNTPEILQQAPLKHIATYLGITDTSLSRIRKELANN